MSKYNEKEKEKQDILIKQTNKKQRSSIFSSLVKGLVSEKMHDLISDCDNFLMYVSDEKMENKKQHKGSSCKNRFCPICSWKKARKDALTLSVMMKYIKEEHKKEFIFLTLTTPNVTAEELEDEIKNYNHAFKKLVERKEVKTVIKGYVRKLEVTHNADKYITEKMFNQRKQYYEKRGLNVGDENPSFNTYHPHFHVLIAVNKSYFTDKDYYISRKRWLELWRKSIKNNLITQVDVQKVKDYENSRAFEVAKYSAKDADYLVTKDIFEVFYKALKGKQLIVFSGLFKEARKKFKNDELDKYLEQDNAEYVYALLYAWGKSGYAEAEKRLLTDDEKKEVNKQLIDEKEVD